MVNIEALVEDVEDVEILDSIPLTTPSDHSNELGKYLPTKF